MAASWVYIDDGDTYMTATRFLLQGSGDVVRYIIVSSNRMWYIHTRGVKIRDMSNKFTRVVDIMLPETLMNMLGCFMYV
jgi:hypothetical protein